jgi:hypothetical protein
MLPRKKEKYPRMPHHGSSFLRIPVPFQELLCLTCHPALCSSPVPEQVQVHPRRVTVAPFFAELH